MADAPKSIHWADITADRIIRQNGEKETYVVASGITPSGTVHFGNFREVITVDLVARALRRKGKQVRFIFSWDDYDTFRKIPKNLPNQELLENYMFQPIVDTPDPYGEAESYAAHQEKFFEGQLEKVGVQVEFLYQAKKYRAGLYREGIATALNKRDQIIEILNRHRSSPLAKDWQPVSVYCSSCNTDNKITAMKWEGEALSYHCENCDFDGIEKLAETTRLKLPWRLDWPMRWGFEKVDFEPGGKDHSSEGGSYTTAKEIVKIFNWQPPVYLQYDFVSIKGAGGKMSSSSGNVITINDVLNVYEPEMLRWIFASYKSNVDFSVSFDLDVIKSYEDYDRQERLAFGVDSGNEKKVNMAKRVFELSQIKDMPKEMPFQPSFRHLTNILQIHDGNIEVAREAYRSEIKNPRDERRFLERSTCALYWLENYAPEEFKFKVNSQTPAIEANSKQTLFLGKLRDFVSSDWASLSCDKDLHEKMYQFIHEDEMSPGEIFPLLYQILISKEKGPKLAGFIRTIGKERVLKLLPS
ncbi:MAG: lysine--tRNA ligase [Halobacteriovoraceae bacterium]|jgi:lysyl-tRNA synthetase, class I|nr:lysine--tRNA ligase [Halobacteriovoraceae bacterium]MBT5095419.1 lysine--tRNA ligase [Halobacteriovoraceae bacterium]